MAIKQKKLFKFGKSLAVSLSSSKEKSTRAEKLKDPKDEPPFFIRGMQADSKDEYWLSLALERIEEETGWGWAYQVPVYGGRMRAGGNVVDFIMYTPGRWTIFDPMGRYWHTGANEDRSQMERVARQKNWNLIAYFTDECPTRESVYVKVRNELGV